MSWIEAMRAHGHGNGRGHADRRGDEPRPRISADETLSPAGPRRTTCAVGFCLLHVDLRAGSSKQESRVRPAESLTTVSVALQLQVQSQLRLKLEMRLRVLH